MRKNAEYSGNVFLLFYFFVFLKSLFLQVRRNSKSIVVAVTFLKSELCHQHSVHSTTVVKGRTIRPPQVTFRFAHLHSNTQRQCSAHTAERALTRHFCCIRGWNESFTVANMPPLQQSRKSNTPTHVPTVGKLRTGDCWLIIPPVWTVYLGDYCWGKATQTAEELLKFPAVIRRTERWEAWAPSWVFRRDVLHSHRSAESHLY